MTPSPRLLALAAILAASPALAVLPPPAHEHGGPRPNADVRALAPTAPSPEQAVALERLRKELAARPGGEVVARFGPQPGSLHLLFRRGGFLTEEAPDRDAEHVARAFAARWAPLLGLAEDGARALILERRFADPGTGAVHLHFAQAVDGVAIHLGRLRVHLDRRHRVLLVGGDTAPSRVLSREERLGPEEALVAAARWAGVLLAEAPSQGQLDERGLVRFARGPFESAPWAAPTWFPLDEGLVRAWRVVVDPAGDLGWYEIVVDARDGGLLSRFDLVSHVATSGLVFREDPGQGPQVSLPFVDDTVVTDPASPLGWSAAGETRGNNCDVKDDLAADNEDTDGRRAVASGPDPLRFDFPFRDDPAQDLDASLTNLFHVNNWLHDRLVRLGFDEASGNFQAVNFTGAGRGGDAVYVDGQDGSGRNNANFGTPPDGEPPRMQMYVWTFANPDRDSGFDASVITHELFHGVSHRLVGVGCLAGPQAGAMGEGWSDWFACSFWNQPTVGGYVVDDYVRGIRRAAYDAYPYHYGQLCNQGGFEVHRDGEIWTAALWDVREAFIARYGYQEGKCKAERLVLDGMKLSPCRPTYVDMRDAIVQAALLSGGPGDACLLWQAFASRGLGVAAVSRTDCTSAGDASFDAPPECAACSLAAPASVVLDASRPNEVTVRFAPSPGATAHLLLRAEGPCPGDCLDAEFVEVARGDGSATELSDRDGAGNRLSAGQRFSYRVAAVAGDACAAYAACSRALVSGRCTLRPVAASSEPLGVKALHRPPSAGCTMRVEWAEAASACGGPSALRYNVYRSEDPAFVPGPEHLVASVAAPLLSWTDAAAPAAELTYVVRAEDLTSGGDGPHGGNEEENLERLTLRPQGLASGAASWSDDGEAGERPGYRRTGSYEPNDWALRQDANTRGGFAWHVSDVEGGNADKNLELPPLSLGPAPRLSFAHAYQQEDCFDGGVLEISTDGGRTWRDLIDAMTQGGYATSRSACGSVTYTVEDLLHPPNTDLLWTGQNASGFPVFDTVAVDLAPWAGTLDARLRLRQLVDPLAAEPGGWYVDDLLVEDVVTFDACATGCVQPPTAVLPDGSGCAAPGFATDVVLDASASLPGAAPFASDLAFVLTHDGPGSFGGRRWAEGPIATLTFPPGAPAGDYTVALTVRAADTCAAVATATVRLGADVPPPGPVGGTLRVAKDPGGLALSWQDVGAVLYNVHATRIGEDLAAIDATVPVANGPGSPLVLGIPGAQPGAGTLFLVVNAASECGQSHP